MIGDAGQHVGYKTHLGSSGLLLAIGFNTFESLDIGCAEGRADG